MIKLIYDTETSGLPDWHNPSGGEQQPHMVQLAAMLVDDQASGVIAMINTIIRPDGWTIPEDLTQRVHGISTEYATEVGIPEDIALDAFLALWRVSDMRIGFSETFDARIIRIATKRYASEAVQEEWKAGKEKARCMMRESMPIMQIPQLPGKRGKYKYPKLKEAYRHFTGRDMPNAHSAYGDMMATWEICRGVDGTAKDK